MKKTILFLAAVMCIGEAAAPPVVLFQGNFEDSNFASIEMARRGELGVKTGKGFYDWSEKSAEEAIERCDRFVIEFLRSHFSR